MEMPKVILLAQGDALVIVDVQKDFLPDRGRLAVPDATKIIPVLNRYIALFHNKGLPIFATRDWHPPDHCSFINQGGIWPEHCIAETQGASFAQELLLPDSTVVISTGVSPIQEGYSGFQDTSLNELLISCRIRTLFIGGLATEYCVFHTVKDALHLGYAVFLLEDCIKGVDTSVAKQKIEEMIRLGAKKVVLEMLTQ
jgi:nicotinamidase/pyrazinamidase